MSADKGCPRCHDRQGHSPVGDAACALAVAVADDVWQHAQTLDKPPTRVQVVDLLAHLNSRYEDRTRSHAAALVVLDLGWRPSVGAP